MRIEENESLRMEIVNSLVRSEFKDDNTYEGAKYIVNKVLEILKRPEFAATETNLEHFKHELKVIFANFPDHPEEMYNRIERELDHDIKYNPNLVYTSLIVEWMAEPYVEPKQPFELTLAEHEVLSSAHPDYPIGDISTLSKLKYDYGWFKGIDTSLKPREILDFCILSDAKEEKSDENN